MMLPHSIEYQEEDLTVRVLFLHLIEARDYLYTEVYISDETSMRYGHQLHVSNQAFRKVTDPESPDYNLMKEIIKPILEIYHEKKNDTGSNTGGIKQELQGRTQGLAENQ